MSYLINPQSWHKDMLLKITDIIWIGHCFVLGSYFCCCILNFVVLISVEYAMFTKKKKVGIYDIEYMVDCGLALVVIHTHPHFFFFFFWVRSVTPTSVWNSISPLFCAILLSTTSKHNATNFLFLTKQCYLFFVLLYVLYVDWSSTWSHYASSLSSCNWENNWCSDDAKWDHI